MTKEICKCKELFKNNPALVNTTFEDLKIKPAYLNMSFKDIRYENDLKIDVSKVTTVTLEKLKPLSFNCEDLESIFQQQFSPDNSFIEVYINNDNGEIKIINGHHRLCWLKLLSMHGIIDKMVIVKKATFYVVEKS